MRIAIGAKKKLGFITGKCKKPYDEDSEEFEDWQNVDFMVQSWILNNIDKRLNDSFLYVKTAKQLWDTLKRRYRQSNVVLLYHLEMEIKTIAQGNVNVTNYFIRLQTLWDEFRSLQPVPTCECKSSETLTNQDNTRLVIRFLMGLNDSNENMKDSILLISPLPDINRVFFMILKAEKQRKVTQEYSNSFDNSALMSKNYNSRRSP